MSGTLTIYTLGKGQNYTNFLLLDVSHIGFSKKRQRNR